MNAKALLVIAVSVIMMVVGTYFFSTLGPDMKAIEAGTLIPFKVDDQKLFDVQMGGIHFLLTVDQLREGYDFQHAVQISGFEYPFKVSFKDGKLLVSAEIKNAGGDVVAKITDNEWSVEPNPIVTYDRNYLSYAFEVIDSDRVPILQVVMTPENKVFVGGVFYSENATLVSMLNGTTIINPIDSDYNQTIFQYPSSSKLGKLVANSPYAFDSTRVILAPDEIIAIGYVMLGIGTFTTLVVGIDSFKKRKRKSDISRAQKKKK